MIGSRRCASSSRSTTSPRPPLCASVSVRARARKLRPRKSWSPDILERANDDLYALGRRAGTLLSRPEKILDRADDHKNFAGEICN